MKPVLGLIALLLCPASLDAARNRQDEKLEIRWKFEKGQEYRYRTVQKTAMDFGGQAITQEMGTTYLMTVGEIDEKGQATVTMKYVAVATKAMTPAGEHDYDSEKDKEAPADGPGAFMAKLIGKSFTMKLSPAGRVRSVEGFEKILDVILKDAGDDAQGEQMRQMFSNDTFKGMMQQMAPPLPEAKVAKGESWTTDFTVKMPMIGGVKFTIKATLTDLKGPDALIEQETQMEVKDPSLPIEIKESKGKASIVFSTQRGVLVSQKSKMKMVMAFNGQEMPITTEMELKLLEK